MPELSEPPAARAAAARASELRRRYQAAVQAIRDNGQLSKDDKRQRLTMLHTQHRQAMDELRRARHDAFRAAEEHAIRRLVRDPGATRSTLVMDSYRRRLEELNGQPIEALVTAYDLADLMDDSTGMRAAAVAALRRRMPGVPGDPATRLVARFADARLPNGSHLFPEAAGGWDDLVALEEWDRAAHLSADAVFSTPATPERPDDPRPRDRHAEARDDVAALYQPNSSQGGGG
jgi:hypothetical protein